MKKTLYFLLICCLSGCSVVEEPLITSNMMEPAMENQLLDQAVFQESGSGFFPIESLTEDEVVSLMTAEIESAFYNFREPTFLELTQRSEEECQLFYLQTMWMESWTLLGEIWAEYPDSRTEMEALEVTKSLFQKVAFRVQSATENPETGHFQVKVSIAPMGGVVFATEDYLLEHFSAITAETDIMYLSQEAYENYDNEASLALLQQIRETSVDMSYGKEQELVIDLLKEEGGYRVELQDWYQFREFVLDYTGIYQ